MARRGDGTGRSHDVMEVAMALVIRAVRGRRHPRPSLTRAVLAVGVAALLAGTVAACGNGSSGNASSSGGTKDGFTQAPQSSGTLTVWVDSTRVPAAQAYKKAHPDVKLNIVTYDGDANGSNTLQTKVDLYDRTGSGWPDVVFSAENNEISWAVNAGFTAPLNEGLIPSSTLNNFATGSLAPCTVNGKVYCLRNDLAADVLWYNAPLMEQWGYQVPTTWPQYEQLGLEVAKQHPGYLVGNAGDTFTPEIYMWASQCQANQHHRPARGDRERDQSQLHPDGLAARHADQGRLDVEAECARRARTLQTTHRCAGKLKARSQMSLPWKVSQDTQSSNVSAWQELLVKQTQGLHRPASSDKSCLAREAPHGLSDRARHARTL